MKMGVIQTPAPFPRFYPTIPRPGPLPLAFRDGARNVSFLFCHLGRGSQSIAPVFLADCRAQW